MALIFKYSAIHISYLAITLIFHFYGGDAKKRIFFFQFIEIYGDVLKKWYDIVKIQFNLIGV